jgi:hypothetical protein
VPARAREWTGVPYWSFPRNEGVPGSSPGVGFEPICREFVGPGNSRSAVHDPHERLAGTKRVRLGPLLSGEVVPFPMMDSCDLQGIHRRLATLVRAILCPLVPARGRPVLPQLVTRTNLR